MLDGGTELAWVYWYKSCPPTLFFKFHNLWWMESNTVWILVYYQNILGVGAKMHIPSWIKASVTTCATLVLKGLASIKLEVSQVVTNKYLKSSNPFWHKFYIHWQSFHVEIAGILAWKGLFLSDLIFVFVLCHILKQNIHFCQYIVHKEVFAYWQKYFPCFFM